MSRALVVGLCIASLAVIAGIAVAKDPDRKAERSKAATVTTRSPRGWIAGTVTPQRAGRWPWATPGAASIIHAPASRSPGDTNPRPATNVTAASGA